MPTPSRLSAEEGELVKIDSNLLSPISVDSSAGGSHLLLEIRLVAIPCCAQVTDDGGAHSNLVACGKQADQYDVEKVILERRCG